jgi:hypothetical protein
VRLVGEHVRGVDARCEDRVDELAQECERDERRLSQRFSVGLELGEGLRSLGAAPERP